MPCWDVEKTGSCPRVAAGQSCKWCAGAPDDGWVPKGKGKSFGKPVMMKGYGGVWQPDFQKGGGKWGGGWGGKGWGGGGGSRGANKNVKAENAASTVWLGGIPAGVTKEEIATNFEAAGSVKMVELIKQGKEGFIIFSSPEEATSAIAMFNGAAINGSAIQVDVWTMKEKTA